MGIDTNFFVEIETNMGHFAKIDENDIVVDVIVAEQEFIDSGAVGDPTRWIRTSYNTSGNVWYDPNTGQPGEDQSKALRKNYAGIGYTYNRILDAFIPPSPYPSWTLNEDTGNWEPPVPYPESVQENSIYVWNEETQNWDYLGERQINNDNNGE